MNDPTKSPPYSCHGGFQGDCESDDDCQSYCMNDPTKNPPYFCHAIKDVAPVFEIIAEGPAKCEVDTDCKSCVRACRDDQCCVNACVDIQLPISC